MILIGMLSFGIPASNMYVVPQPKISFVVNDQNIKIPHKRYRNDKQRRRIVYV